jgi:hypothetical protein
MTSKIAEVLPFHLAADFDGFPLPVFSYYEGCLSGRRESRGRRGDFNLDR